jgi:hypothetical protein
MDRSRVYLIDGTMVQEVIDGQSVITGYLLEVRTELFDALTPHIVSVCYNIPYIYSVYETEGALIGIVKICPAQILTATTYQTDYTNCTMEALIPGNTTENGTIRVKTDRLYFQGASADWVNISVNSTGAKLQNTSYIPVFYDIFGETVDIDASHNVTVTRETSYQQVDQFSWTKYTNQNYYTATVEFSNPMNTTLKKVYLFIEFANDTTPDYSTVTVRDVTNGVWLTQGENFDASASGTHMYIDSMSGLESRFFTVTYYGREIEEIPSDAITVISDYGQMKPYNNKNHYYLRAQWVNTRGNAFLGPIYIQFNFTTAPYEIAAESIAIYDNENVEYLNRNDFAYHGSGIIVSQEQVGRVSPQGARTFEIYYLYISEETIEQQIEELAVGFLHKPIFTIPILGPFLGIHFINSIFGAVAIAGALADYKKHKWVIALMVLFIWLFSMAYFQPFG